MSLYDDVENAIETIAKQLNMSREDARRLLHRYVCTGLCGWYEREAEKNGVCNFKVNRRTIQGGRGCCSKNRQR